MTQERRAQSAKAVGSARNATRILDYLSRQPAPVRLTDIVGALGINSSTCFNILHTLVEDGFVIVQNRAYSAGPELVHLAYRVLESVDDLSRVQMLIERFSQVHRVSVVLWHLDQDNVVAVRSQTDNSMLLSVNVSLMRKMPMLTGSVGRVIAGLLPLSAARLKAEFARAQWPSLTLEQFKAQAALASERGYAIETGDYSDGIHAIAAPVPGPQDGIFRIVSIYALANDLPLEAMSRVGEALVQLASEIGFTRQGA